MRLQLHLALFLLMPILSFSQNNDKVFLLDSLENESYEDFHYLRKIKEYYSPSEKEEYIVEDYYKSGKIQMIGKSTNKDVMIKNGDFKFYYENGNKQKIMKYEKSVPIGKIYLWHENGTMKAAGEFIASEKKKEEPELKILQYWDAEKTQKVIDGNGIYDSDDEYYETTSSGPLVNGSRNGEWTGKNTRLRFTFKETYQNGKLISGESIDSIGLKHIYTKVFQTPEPIGGIEKFTKYIAKNYKAPQNVNVLADSRLQVSFIVEKDGKITKVKIRQSLRKDFDDAAIRVIKAYDKWQMGLFRGIPIRVSYNLPIVIRKNT